MKQFLFFIIILSSINTFSQVSKIKGYIFDDKGNPLSYANVALLHPKDSTLVNSKFAITDHTGLFEIAGITNGKYIIQAAYLGFNTYQRLIEITKNETISAIILVQKSIAMKDIEIVGEKIPILIKKDTMEYNASAYRVKPDAVTEDLLRKMPGIEVDRSGNIKSMGEDVKKVLVDGKEFFSNDPKIATKNLPASAVKKIQVYNKKSEKTELTGIDDGSYEKTLDIRLKDNSKNGLFGEIKSGYGSDERYQLSGKTYNFTKNSQFAVIGLYNNIGKTGFSLNDYLDFNGGINALKATGGGSMSMSFSDDDIGFDMGRTSKGETTGGSFGINFSHEYKKGNRYFFSYLLNNKRKSLNQTTNSSNFINDNSFTQNSLLNQNQNYTGHKMNYGCRFLLDSSQKFVLVGSSALKYNKQNKNSISTTYNSLGFVNELNDTTFENNKQFASNLTASWMKRGNNMWRLLSITFNGSYSHHFNTNDWKNLTRFFNIPDLINNSELLDYNKTNYNYSFKISELIKVANRFYAETSVETGKFSDNYKYTKNNKLQNSDEFIPEFEQTYNWIKPGIDFKFILKKSKTIFSILANHVSIYNNQENNQNSKKNYIYWLPQFNWEYNYQTSKRIDFRYATSLTIPSPNQIAPISLNTNPLMIYENNFELQPEYQHRASLGWMYFDQFSSISLFAYISGAYIKNKINVSAIYHENLSQTIKYVNVKDEYQAQANIDFSSPIRFIGIKTRLGITEQINKGINFINNIENNYTSYNHSFSLSIENRNNEIWDIRLGARLNISDVTYTINNSLNNRFTNSSYFGDISWTPSEKWYFSINADIANYNSESFNQSFSLPLINAEINFFFLKNNQGMLAFEVYDMLNKNKGISRVGNMNYLQETKYNVMQRYFMLTFKYRLNSFGSNKRDFVIR